MLDSSFDIFGVSPTITLAVCAVVVLILDLLKLLQSRFLIIGSFVILALVLSFQNLSSVGAGAQLDLFDGTVSVDPLGSCFSILVIIATAASIAISDNNLKEQGMQETTDIFVLMLLGACGALVMLQASDFVIMFLGYELVSIPAYILTGLSRNERASSEASLKYFVTGSFASAFMLYGIALIYGASGSTLFSEVSLSLTNDGALISKVGLGLVIFGFAFKLAASPFHFWAPDVYQGAPTGMSLYMATVVKLGALGAFIRVLTQAFGNLELSWAGFIWILSVLSMLIGNFSALRQKSPKRMLAYSSIAHVGYMLVALLCFGNGGAEALTFYAFSYVFMTIVSFGVVLVVNSHFEDRYERDSFKNFKALGFRSPWLAISMSIALLSLAGMPPFMGFFGKLYIFQAAISKGYIGLVIIAVLNSLLSLYYYLRVIVEMYFLSSDHEEQIVSSSYPALLRDPQARIIIGLSASILVLCGVFAEPIALFSRLAGSQISFLLR